MAPQNWSVAEKVISVGTANSPFPASFNDNPWLYGASLAALICVDVFFFIVAWWMSRDLWRDRWVDHPTTLVFLWRLMLVAICGGAFIRILPEVLVMTLYGEVTGHTMGIILSVKRSADIIALPIVLFWMAILVLIYPNMMIVLKDKMIRSITVIDPLTVWPRLMRALVIMLTVIFISTGISIAKWSMGH